MPGTTTANAATIIAFSTMSKLTACCARNAAVQANSTKRRLPTMLFISSVAGVWEPDESPATCAAPGCDGNAKKREKITKRELLEENQLLKQRLAERDEKVARQAEVITKLEASRTALHKALHEVTERGTN